MKLGKITIFEDGKCTVEIKDRLLDEWRWGDAFDNLKDAHNYAKNEHCIFISVDKDNGEKPFKKDL